MKKIIILAAAIGLGSMVSSCKKDYTCNCTKTYTGSTTTVAVKDGTYTYKDTKSKATDKCDANEKTGSDVGGDYTRNCDIQ